MLAVELSHFQFSINTVLSGVSYMSLVRALDARPVNIYIYYFRQDTYTISPLKALIYYLMNLENYMLSKQGEATFI